VGILTTLDASSTAGTRARSLVDDVRAEALPIAGMLVTGPGGARITADYPRGLRGLALTRRHLDLRLVEAATAAGVMFDDGVGVRGPIVAGDGRVVGVEIGLGSRDDRLSARLVIAADGRGSRIASALALSTFARVHRRWAFGAYFTGIHGLAAYGEMHIRPNGYLGVAPLPGGLANVCAVRELAAGRRGAVDERRVITQAVEDDPILRERFVSARQVTDVTTLGPLAVDARRAGRPGVLLAGDAAGFVDPMTGDGLRFALRGGILAAEAALTELSSGVPAWRALQTARAREFAGKWRINRALRKLAGSPRALGLAALVAEYWADPVKYLVGVAGDVSLVPHSAPAVHQLS
jgi:flavin-dependent dehydrogenase